jgi:hypothetical protein
MNPWDTAFPFRLVIAITKGDNKGQVLSRMANGTIIAYKDLSSAVMAATEFLDLASKVESRFNSYGVVSVVDEQHQKVEFSRNID